MQKKAISVFFITHYYEQKQLKAPDYKLKGTRWVGKSTSSSISTIY